METDVVPRQKKGASFDIRESRMLTDREDAVAKYLKAKHRLLQVSQWGELAGEPPDTFKLTDSEGNGLERDAREGDRIKIHLPGPLSLIGGGEDWVVIEKIIEEKNLRLDEFFTAMTLRPGPNPCSEKSVVAHFFGKYSTNTLLVSRHRTEIVASIHGRNEQVNTETDWLDMLRNMLVALPAKAGLSNPHWKQLAKSLIK
jgi:hypothetical protein